MSVQQFPWWQFWHWADWLKSLVGAAALGGAGKGAKAAKKKYKSRPGKVEQGDVNWKTGEFKFRKKKKK